ncbi:hypothetical protein BBAL3_1679 [Brevundimonas sp. BAL3]|uniref:phage tail protein n=1 Tax=Brevundimonas sp. BAL3 TaxID=391600 RepID=UPI00017ED88F|nr:phage tail protein [Brevundimonas sp. BAL3]EDX80522.1 hypothetical protein BBAL3_1679 [Brevundimonas sp. BAL3]
MPQVVAVAAAWVAKTLTVKAVAAFVVKTALQAVAAVALSKAAKALGLSKQSIQERQASVTSLSLGEGPREAAFGVVCTGGTLLDAFNFGGKYGTDTVTRVIDLFDHPVDAIVGYYVDDVYYAWTGDGVQPGFNGKLSIEFKNGVAGGNVPPLHVREHGGWDVEDVLDGVTHVVVDTRYDDAVWTSGHPRFKFVLRGLRVYDPRRDPALGYSGPNPQTWEDTSTHVFSRNAILNRYAYERGIYAAGHQGEAQHLLIGRGLTAEEAPPSRVIAAANLCDELVDSEMRYAADGVIFANQSFDEVEELFAAAMAGVLVQREGGLEIEPGQAKAAVVTITDGDLVGGKPMGMSPFLPDSDGGRVNTIVPRYVEPTQGWLDHAAPVIRDLSRMAPAPVGDGGPREMTLPLALVTVGNQANRNGGIALRKAALERRATITLPPKFAGIEEGDWIAWTSARRFGGATVRFRVVSFSLDAGWQNSLVLEEIASSVYGVPDPVEDLALPPPAPVPVDALQLLGVTAEPITLAGETSTLPAVRFGWDVGVADTAITGIRAEIRKSGATDAAPTLIDDVAKGAAVVTGGVWPDTVLECRLVPFGDPTRPVLASNWITVSTSGLVAGDVSATSPTIAQINADIAALFGDIFDVSELIGQTRADLEAADAALGSAIGSLDNRADTLESQTASLETNKASVSSLNAQVARIDGVEAVNATQALALVDLEIGKVAVSEYDTLKAEVQNARDGSSTLLGKIQALKAVDLDLQNNKATVSSVTALEARTTTTEADIIDLEIALATETGARAEAISQIEARSSGFPNTIQNPDYKAGFVRWHSDGVGAVVPGNSPTIGSHVYFECPSIYSDVYSCGEGDVFSLSQEGASGTGGRAYIQFLPGFGFGAITPFDPSGAFARVRSTTPAVAPAGTTGYRIWVDRGAGTFTLATRFKVNTGPVAADYSDDADARQISASVTEQSLAIIDLENNAAAAGFSKIAEASGGAPAYYEFVSSTSGGYAVIAAPLVALVNTSPGGAPLVALQAVDGKVQVTNSVEIGVGATGTTIQSAASGARVVIKNSQIAMYDG